MKDSIAVVGSGIAGMASAYYLRDHFDVHLFEADNYIGGHTNTRFVEEDKKKLPIDTGFMVFNNHTYPNLIKLFKELEVTTYPTSMSFGVRNDNTGLEYSSNQASGFFAQKRRWADPRHWMLLKGMKEFFANALDFSNSHASPDFTIRDFATKYGVSKSVMRDFLIPMAGAIWSTPPQGIMDFPAIPMLRFMKNHRMLGIGIQYQWQTVEGGSQQYKRKLLAKLYNQPTPGLGVSKIQQHYDSVSLTLSDGSQREFKQAIVATHADDALKLLSNPTGLQHDLLSNFKYNKNTAILHSDESVMPQQKNAWASWNVAYRETGQQKSSSTHYWMNSLQRIDTNKNYFVSVDSYQEIEPNKIHWQKSYSHPRFDSAAIKAQPLLQALNKSSSLSFCGSYFRNGFHEDAIWSSLQAVEQILNGKEVHHEISAI